MWKDSLKDTVHGEAREAGLAAQFKRHWLALPAWLRLWMLLGLGWLLVGMAATPSGPKVWNPGKYYHDSLIALFLLPAAWLAWSWRRPLVRGLLEAREGKLLLVFLAWALLSVTWARHGKFGDDATVVFYVLTFVTLMASLVAGQPRRAQTLLYWAGAGLALAALVSMAVFPLRVDSTWQEQDRLVGFGTLDNPNLAAFAFGAASVWLLQLSVRGRWQRVLQIGAIVVLMTFVLLTFTRSIWLALIATQAVMLLAAPHRHIRRRAAAMLGVAAVIIALGGWQYMKERGLSYRPEILQQSLAMIGKHPWLGLGMGSHYDIVGEGQTWEHSHNILSHLAILLGVPAMLLWSVLWLVVGWRAWRYRHVMLGRIMLALWIYASVAWQFDAPQLLRRPDVEWLLGWLPVAMSVGLSWRIRARGAQVPPRSVSLLVLTYNWPEALARVLASVAAQSRLPDEVIVADDGSGPATRAVIERLARDFPVPLRHVWQEDLGFRASRCRNLGIAASRSEYIVLIDGDMVLHPDFIADHLALAGRGHFLQGGRFRMSEQATGRLLAGGRPTFAPWADADFQVFDGIKRLYAFRSLALARWKSGARSGGRVMSCNMSCWREDLLRVNGFDEQMEGYGAEDRELAARLGNAGVRRRALKWAALAAHLEHRSRAQEEVDDPNLPNNQVYLRTVREHITRCEQGIDAHLAAMAAGRSYEISAAAAD